LQLQQSVLGDDHPTVRNTMNCIEQVEQAESNAEESKSLFSSWKSFRGEGSNIDDPDLGLHDLMTIMSCFTLKPKSKQLYPTNTTNVASNLETTPSSTTTTARRSMNGHDI
jgi:hypothetical protein